MLSYCWKKTWSKKIFFVIISVKAWYSFHFYIFSKCACLTRIPLFLRVKTLGKDCIPWSLFLIYCLPMSICLLYFWYCFRHILFENLRQIAIAFSNCFYFLSECVIFLKKFHAPCGFRKKILYKYSISSETGTEFS